MRYGCGRSSAGSGGFCLFAGFEDVSIVPNFIMVYKTRFHLADWSVRLMNDFSPAVPLRGTWGDGSQQQVMARQKPLHQDGSCARN